MKAKFAIALCVLLCMAGLTALAGDAQLQITSPRPNSTVSAGVIELSGTGADPTGTLEVDVLTNQWWPQDGVARINADGSWTYSPVYISGQGVFNNHTIRVTQIKDHKRGKSTSVSGIVRKQ
jgi:hypothetical protein